MCPNFDVMGRGKNFWELNQTLVCQLQSLIGTASFSSKVHTGLFSKKKVHTGFKKINDLNMRIQKLLSSKVFNVPIASILVIYRAKDDPIENS
jgi:hypothetical protein